MSDLSGLFDALYSRLLLRDFFGKIVPGSIVVISICFVLLPSWEIQKLIHSYKIFHLLLFFGLAWLAAFAVQAVGEKFHLIRYHSYESNKIFYARRYKFDHRTEPAEHQQFERLVVIKEACGNGYLALSLSMLLFLVNTLVTKGFQAITYTLKSHWPVYVFIIFLTIFLAIMHFIHVKRQDEYMDTILLELDTDSSSKVKSDT